MKRALKWFAVLFLGFLLLLVAAVLTFPFWFGSALGTAGQRFGLSFSKYEKLNNGRFALTDVVRTNSFFDFRAGRVEAYLPPTWYRQVKATNRTASFLEVNGWKVIVHDDAPGKPNRGESNSVSVYEGWKVAEHYISQARQWLPKATLLNGTVEYRGREYTFPVATWEEGKLDAGGVWPVSSIPFEVKGKLSGEGPYQASFIMPSMDLRGRLQIAETNGFLNTKLTAFYKDSRMDADAYFAREGRLPQTATLRAPNFTIPGDLLKIQQYNEFTGSLSGSWQTNRYQLQLKAHAEPISGANLPAADIELAATGNTNLVRIEKARSTAPGLEVAISDPIEVTYGGQLLSERSELRLAADFEKLPWLKLKGHFEGTLLLKKGEKFPSATIRAAGKDIEAYHVHVRNVQIAGTFDWPRVQDLNVEAQFGTNGVVALRGSADLKTLVLGETSLRVAGAIPTNLLPANIHLESVQLTAHAVGSLSNLTHGGEFEVRNFATTQTQPLQLQGTWNAEQITFDKLAMRIRAGPAVLFLSGRGYADADGRTNFIVRELSLNKGDETYLQLAGEATLSVTTNRLLQLTPLRLSGKNRELVLAAALAWPHHGKLDIEAQNLSPALFQSFVVRSLRELDLRRLLLSAHWSNGPVFGRATGSLSVAQEQLQRLGTDLELELDEAGLALTKMTVWDHSGEIGEAHGFLPVSFNLVEQPRLHLSRRDRIDFELRTTTNQAFWNTIAQLGRVHLTNAAVDLVVHGTSARPTGELHLTADAIKLAHTNRELPTIGPLDARIALNEQFLRIREFSLRVLDQPASISGGLALGSNFWTQRREEIIKYALDNADLKMEAPVVKLAPFASYLPKYVTPQGELSVNVSVKPGRNLDGRVELQGVETRPLPNIGVVQSVRAALDLRGQKVEIQELSGVIGGERMSVAGQIDLSPESVAKGYPDVDLRITGKNVPLARNPDVILRSDLNLNVRNGTNQIPVIAGDVILRDSFLLRDISTLVPGRLARPSRRPPYFSIEQDPIDEWKLNVHVRGENFMRVRSPFFQGLVSANFRVTGTALEPMSLGEANISSGQIIFPFATLDVRQALVSLTTEDPYLPHIFAIAAGRAFGFDVRMEAEGPANEPVIQFTSVPALSSEQIVLMLTTGQIPREDFSFSQRDRVGKLAVFLGKSLLSKLRPGKPAEEKLSIRSGQDITEQGRQTYEVEYKLSPRWSLVGEYDRFGALNANVKWRIVSR